MLIPFKVLSVDHLESLSIPQKYVDTNFKTVGSVHPKWNSPGDQTIEFTNLKIKLN